MRILHIISCLGGGGRERRMTQLVAETAKRPDVEIHILTMSGDAGYMEQCDARVCIHYIDPDRRLKYLSGLYRLLRDVRPDIVHSWIDTKINLLFLPVICRILGARYLMGFIADGNYVDPGSLYGRCIRFSAKRACAIVSNSQAGLDAKNCNTGNAVVIYNGFDYSRFSKELDIPAMKRKLDIRQRFVAIMCARFSAEKDYDSYVRLAAEFSDKDILFLAVGSGDDFDRVRSSAAGLDNVRFLGQRNDTDELIRMADVAVLFTDSRFHAEGVSNFILESMAAGKPVIATEGGGTSEIITDGEDGFIVPPSDYGAAAKLLTSLYNDGHLCDKIGRSAVETVKSRFLLTDMADKYMSVYQRILSK